MNAPATAKIPRKAMSAKPGRERRKSVGGRDLLDGEGIEGVVSPIVPEFRPRTYVVEAGRQACIVAPLKVMLFSEALSLVWIAVGRGT